LQTPYPAPYRSTIAYFSAFVALGLALSVFGPALPGLAENTGTRIGEIGFLFTGSSLGYMIGSLSFGRILDRSPGNKLLALLLFTMGASLALVPIFRELWALTALMIILGIAEGGVDISTNLMLVWIHRDRSNPFLNVLHFFFGAGAFLAPVFIARSRLATTDISWAFWILAIYPLPTAVWLLFLPSPKPDRSKGEIETTPTNWSFVALIALVFMFYVGAEIGFGGWIYTYAVSLSLADITGAALLTSFFWGALTLGRLFGIALASRFPPRLILVADLIGCLISLGLILLFPQSSQIIWIGTIALGLSMASIFPSLLAFSSKYLMMSGQVTRWFFVGTGAGGIFLPWLLGMLIETHGPTSIMLVLWLDLGIALLAFLSSLMLVNQNRPNLQSQIDEYN
jgi:MFS transporter, FHS family, Na+ dependent glucose transporter 1